MKNSSESPKKRLKASLLGYRPSAAARPAGVAVVDPELLTPESLAREEKLRLRIRQEAGVKKRLTAEAQKGLPPSTHLTKVCEVCGTEFHKPQNRTMERWRAVRFCSVPCRNMGLTKEKAAYRAEYTEKIVIDENNPVIKEMAARTLSRRSLLQFTKKTHVAYDAGWVHADICKRLERFSAEVRAKKSPRLMLLMPPRTGKSELASIRFPAWHLGHSPGHEVINVGYNTDLPMRFSRRVRELVRDPLYQGIFPECRLDPESQSIESWNTTQGGGFTAAGVGGGITGKGAHVLIVDDPIKNQEEADSVYTRDSLWDWYLSTAYTRLSPGGGVLVIQTWWNDDDLAGRLQNAMKNVEADQFEIVKYPALAEQYEYREVGSMLICRYDAPLDPAHEALIRESYARTGLPVLVSPELEIVRAPGHALHPQRYDESLMHRIKATLTPRIWSALYQQNPVPDEGMYFRKEYIRYEVAPPPTRGKHLFTAWDFAIGEKQMNDYTVGVTLLQDEHDALHVVDVIRFRGDSFVIVEAMLDTYMRWGIDTLADYVIGVEDGQIWKSIKPLLEKRMVERKNFPSYETLKPLTDKIARARPLQGRMQQGRVYFPENASWLPDAIHELLRFPAGVHDDIVDALAWAVHLSMSRPPPRPPEYKELPSWRDNLEGLGALDGSHMAA